MRGRLAQFITVAAGHLSVGDGREETREVRVNPQLSDYFVL